MKSALQNLTCRGELQNDRGDRKLSLLFMGKDVEKLLLTMMKGKLTGLTSGNTVRYLEVYFLFRKSCIQRLKFFFFDFFLFSRDYYGPRENWSYDKMIINIAGINEAMRENSLMAGKFSILGLGNGRTIFPVGRKPTFK